LFSLRQFFKNETRFKNIYVPYYLRLERFLSQLRRLFNERSNFFAINFPPQTPAANFVSQGVSLTCDQGERLFEDLF
jgi:hypothetical protein